MVVNKYLAGLLTLLTSLLAALVAIPQAQWAEPEVIWQFVALVVSSGTAIFLPLVTGPWAAGLKVGSAVILAGVGAILPLLGGEWGATQWVLLAVAVLNALAIQLGVDIRVDSAKKIIIDPTVNSAIGKDIDPKATQVATRQLIAAHEAPSDGGAHAGR